MTTNTETVRTFFALVGERDLKLIELFADEFHWYVPGDPHFPWSGKRSQKSELPGFFAALWPMTVPGETNVRVDQFIEAGSHVVVMGEFDHKVASTGDRFKVEVVFHFIIEAGKIVHLHMYEDTLAAARAFRLGLA
jgi:uncharacterized protein